MSEGWRVQIVPEGTGRSRSFRVSRRVVAAAGLAALVLVGFSLAWLGFLGQDVVRTADLNRLETENRELRADVQAAERQAAHLSRSLDAVATRETRFRLMAGLPLIDPEVREVGVGGVDAGSNAATSRRVSDRIAELHRRAELLSSSIAEATDSVTVNRELFRAIPTIHPVVSDDKWISSGFTRSRHHPVLLHNRPHEGIDISAPYGTPFQATAAGRVTFAGRSRGYGLLVEIDHGFGYQTRYAHASRLLVRRGDRVERGDIIGEIGDTGITTSPHLHYEVWVDGRPVDPRSHLLDARVFE